MLAVPYFVSAFPAPIINPVLIAPPIAIIVVWRGIRIPKTRILVEPDSLGAASWRLRIRLRTECCALS